MHTGNHSAKSTGKKTDLEPGEYIITDLQGPYVRDRNGEKYSQIFIDSVWESVGSETQEKERVRYSDRKSIS